MNEVDGKPDRKVLTDINAIAEYHHRRRSRTFVEHNLDYDPQYRNRQISASEWAEFQAADEAQTRARLGYRE